MRAPQTTHTLVVDDSTREMITFLHVSGALIYYDDAGLHVAMRMVNSKIAMCRHHFENVGLGVKFVQRFIR
jgi:hypothetical protein